ncbi:MAG: membrane integrity-associated transporter subunit PqiC [Rhodanobacter sp.]|nr:MAG: membrane integrity-associated transporter subunit PqiC [Rhodanobacter sp.]
MMRQRMYVLGLAVMLLLSGCASAPMHYYTLVPPAGSAADITSAAANPGAVSLPFELLPVSVPAQVDQPQLLVRQGGQGVVLLNDRRWIAPLGDEVRSALAVDLARALGSQDVSGLPGGDKPRLRVKLDLRRFDSQAGHYALMEGAWSVRAMHVQHGGVLACTSRIREAVGPGYDALVQGHQRAIGVLAGQIAAVARRLAAGQAAACPPR